MFRPLGYWKKARGLFQDFERRRGEGVCFSSWVIPNTNIKAYIIVRTSCINLSVHFQLVMHYFCSSGVKIWFMHQTRKSFIVFSWLDSKYKFLLFYWCAKSMSRFWTYCTQTYKNTYEDPSCTKDVTKLSAIETQVVFQGYYKQQQYFKLIILCLSLFCTVHQLSSYLGDWLFLWKHSGCNRCAEW